jgi:hypothetical protein
MCDYIDYTALHDITPVCEHGFFSALYNVPELDGTCELDSEMSLHGLHHILSRSFQIKYISLPYLPKVKAACSFCSCGLKQVLDQ